LALPVFKELMLRVYRENLVGPVPIFPAQMEQNINDYLAGRNAITEQSVTGLVSSDQPGPLPLRFTVDGDGVQRLP